LDEIYISLIDRNRTHTLEFVTLTHLIDVHTEHLHVLDSRDRQNVYKSY